MIFLSPWQKQSFIILTLASDLLARILPVQHIREHLRSDIAKIEFTNQLRDLVIDKEDRCAVELARIEDE